MNAMFERQTARFRFRRESVPENEGRHVISTGLSVTVAGHLIHLDRDERKKLATVVVDPIADVAPPTANEESAVHVAAELLARRARRFLGGDWVVRDYKQF